MIWKDFTSAIELEITDLLLVEQKDTFLKKKQKIIAVVDSNNGKGYPNHIKSVPTEWIIYFTKRDIPKIKLIKKKGYFTVVLNQNKLKTIEGRYLLTIKKFLKVRWNKDE